MIERDNSYAAWAAEKRQNEAWCAVVDRALPAFERRLPRDPSEAALLRSIGTPEALIGPERQPGCETAEPVLATHGPLTGVFFPCRRQAVLAGLALPSLEIRDGLSRPTL